MEEPCSVKKLYESYKQWVCNNPTILTELETVATWSSYFIAGKINNSPVVSESVYTASKLLSLLNDTILREFNGDNFDLSGSLKNRLKLLITVIHYSEVLMELVVRRKWDHKGKWSIATLLQLIKCTSSLVLLFKYREQPILHPPIPILQRKQFSESKLDDMSANTCFSLKRTGKIIRKVESAPPIAFRDWQPVKGSLESTANNDQMNSSSNVAEFIHIVKPIIHLASVKVLKKQEWKQWFISLSMDILSLHLHRKQKRLTKEANMELSRRKLSLLLYLLRTPMYEKYTHNVIGGVLNTTSKTMPFTSFICSSVEQYLKHWQDIYFFMWSS